MLTTGRIYSSQQENPQLWKALDYVTAVYEPDKGVAIAKQINYVVAFGQWTTQFFYDAGNPVGSPLGTNQGYNLEIGCANGNSVAQLDQSLIWVGASRLRGRSVYMLEGTSPVKISDRYIDKYLNNDPMNDIKSYVMKFSGHTLYVLTLHSSDITFVYDVDEKVWSIWSTADGYFKGTYFTSDQQNYFIQHDDTGVVSTMNEQWGDDNGADIVVQVITDIHDSGTTKKKFYRSLEIVGDKVVGTATVQHSDNDYQSWSTARTVDLSVARAILHQLGSSRRRAWKLTFVSSQPFRIVGAEIGFDIGGLEGATSS